ncbi:CbiX/SirB N-terminal domain-containing protein [Gordonia sp. NB41Y]|uniref:sirohydrochlorin chelatase n=1 Tax=Gordonia sp. NB41Y TaxID=875808 RepID=UPI0021C72BFC|nr:CbiX/SirB N-terminal domain-containing protein [Gordonia sp. NB41Y]WLP90188.1 CbiX/SirB N-terminal domain-containing protein [Gordonia sp. NB41Y]
MNAPHDDVTGGGAAGTPPTLLLVAHGSRDPRFADTACRVRRAVARQLPHVAVRISYLDLNSPLVADEVAAVSGAAVVVPLLLAPGYHSSVDLPAIIADAAPAAPVVTTDVVGTTSLAEALADRLHEAGMRPDDGILMTAVGSSQPCAERLIRRRAVELSTRLHRPVDVVFATALGVGNIKLRTAVRRLHYAGATRIVLSPYFLSAGLLTERAEQALDTLAPGSLVAGPIGAHPALIDAICDKYRAGVRQMRPDHVLAPRR